MTETCRPSCSSRAVLAAAGAFALVLGLLPLAPSAQAIPPNLRGTDDGQATTAQATYPTYEDYPGSPGNIVERDAEDGLPATDRYRGIRRHDTAGQIATDDQTVLGDGFRNSDEAIIARADDFPDSLAGSFTAGLFDAPILLVDTSGSLEENTEAALEVIDPEVLTVLGGTDAVSQQAADDAAAVGSQTSTINRLSGSTRFETAEDIAGTGDVAELNGQRTAFLATGLEFADALVAGQLSFQGHPILLTTPDDLHSAADRAIDDNGIEQVVILGGTDAISSSVESEVQAKGVDTTRVGDADRAGTATKVAQMAIDDFGFSADHATMATGFRFPDALTAGPHAGKEQNVLFLTRGVTFLDGASGNDTQPSEFLQQHACDTESIHLAGGHEAISADLEDTIREHSECIPDAGTVSGTVTNAGTGETVEGATLELANDEVETTTTDASGEYLFDPVEPGDYELSADATGKVPETRTVTVGDGEDVTEDFDLEDKLTVEVEPETQTVGETATATATLLDDEGAPDEGVTVDFTTEHSEDGEVVPPAGSDDTDANGEATFEFTTPETGTVTVTGTVDGIEDSDTVEFVEGDTGLANVAISDIGQSTSETQTVSFDISDAQLAENETVTVDVGNATDLGVDYDGATFSTTGSGTASMNTTGDAIVYEAGTGGDADGDTITIEIVDVDSNGVDAEDKDEDIWASFTRSDFDDSAFSAFQVLSSP